MLSLNPKREEGQGVVSSRERSAATERDEEQQNTIS